MHVFCVWVAMKISFHIYCCWLEPFYTAPGLEWKCSFLALSSMKIAPNIFFLILLCLILQNAPFPEMLMLLLLLLPLTSELKTLMFPCLELLTGQCICYLVLLMIFWMCRELYWYDDMIFKLSVTPNPEVLTHIHWKFSKNFRICYFWICCPFFSVYIATSILFTHSFEC